MRGVSRCLAPASPAPGFPQAIGRGTALWARSARFTAMRRTTRELRFRGLVVAAVRHRVFRLAVRFFRPPLFEFLDELGERGLLLGGDQLLLDRRLRLGEG